MSMLQKRSYKFRIYPNSTQKVLLSKTFGCVRYIWNQFVESFNKKENPKSTTINIKSGEVTADKRSWMECETNNSVVLGLKAIPSEMINLL